MRILNQNTKDKTSELISLVLQGNGKAVEGFYNMLIPFITSVIRKQAFQINGTSSSELAHDILVKTYYKLEKYDHSKPLFPWISRIIKNHLIDQYRKQKAQKTKSLDEMLENHSYDYFDVYSSSQSPSPEKLLKKKQEHDELNLMLGRLSEYDRSLIESFYFSGLSLKQISFENNTSINAVSLRIFRAKNKLRKTLTNSSAIYT